MKRIISLLGVVVMAVFAFSAVSAVTASAAEPTKILPEPTAAAPLTDAVSQPGEGHLLSTGGTEVKCKKGKGTEEWTSPNLGTGKVLFEGCTSSLSTTCTGSAAGETAGDIASEGAVHFWLALLMTGTKEKETTELVSALVLLNKEVKFTCVNATKTIEVKVVVKPGCVASQDLPASLNKLVKSVKEEFKEWSSGEQSILFVLPEESKTELECLLRVNVNGAATELSALFGTLVAEGYKKGGKAIEIELMN